jgi:hypothetical protein
MLLELRDLPRGWRAVPADRDIAAEDALRDCLGADFSSLTIVGEAFSKGYAAEHTNASSKATVFADDGQAKDSFGRIADGMERDAAGCYRKQFESANVLDVDEVAVVELPSTEQPGIDESRGWQIVVSFFLSPDEPSRAAYLELLTLRRGAAVATLRTTEAAGPIDAALRGRLVRALAHRMSGVRRE